MHCSRASQFEIAPGALELFSFKGDKDDLANSEKLKGHALKVRRSYHARASTRRRSSRTTSSSGFRTPAFPTTTTPSAAR